MNVINLKKCNNNLNVCQKCIRNKLSDLVICLLLLVQTSCIEVHIFFIIYCTLLYYGY